MTIVTFMNLRGHQIYYDGEEWRFEDTNELTVDGYQRRPCARCKKPVTKEGHDPCLGTIPNVMNACCGHGDDTEGYIQHMDGSIIRGRAAMTFIEDHHKVLDKEK